MATLFPSGFYDNTLRKTELTNATSNKTTTLPLAKDIKQNLNTGEFILDSKKDFVIITGLEAVIQMCRRQLLTPKQNKEKTSGFIIYSSNYGSRIYLLFGKTKTEIDFYAEEYIMESLSSIPYVTGISNFEIEKVKTGEYNLKFVINTVYGNTTEEIPVEGNK